MIEKMPLELVVLSSDFLEQGGERFAFNYETLNVKDRVPLDYDHDEEQIVGYVEAFDFSSDRVAARAVLLSGESSPNDRANQIAYALENGVPFEVSAMIECPVSDARRVKKDEKITVNGREVEGPLTVYDDAVIRGVAICPYGCDSQTSARPVALKNAAGYLLTATQGTIRMAENEEKKPVSAPIAPETPEAVDEIAETEKRTVDPVLVAFIELLGLDEGVKAYLDGVDIEEARAKVAQAAEESRVDGEIAELRKDLDALRALVVKLSRRGDPVGVSDFPARPSVPLDPVSAAAEKFRRQGVRRV